jgi:pilus assembly protein Flp/PilA
MLVIPNDESVPKEASFWPFPGPRPYLSVLARNEWSQAIQSRKITFSSVIEVKFSGRQSAHVTNSLILLARVFTVGDALRTAKRDRRRVSRKCCSYSSLRTIDAFRSNGDSGANSMHTGDTFRHRNLSQQKEEKMNTLKMLWQDEEGQDLVEYGLLLVLISLVAVGAMKTLGSGVSDAFSNAAANLANT